MKSRTLAAVLGLAAMFLFVGPALAAGQVGEEPGPTVTVEPFCDNALSGFSVVGAGFDPSEPVFTGLQVIQDGSLIYFLDGVPLDISTDGTFEAEVAEWEGPVTFVVSFYGGPTPLLSETLFVDCSKPATKQQCKKGGWRDFGSRNQGQCVASLNRGSDRLGSRSVGQRRRGKA